jgi:hypothetical protein
MTANGPARSRAWLAVIALALLVRLPALAWDFYLDDHGLMLVLDSPERHPTLRWWSLFDFGGRPADAQSLEATLLPWWTSADWKVRFFRPIPSMTHALDHALFGANAVLHHASSLAWFALLLVLLRALYREVGLGERLATMALAIFAFEDGSLLPVAWLANRNTLVETTFAVAAACVALRATRSGSVRVAVLSIALALGACLSKESGVAVPLLVAGVLGSGARERTGLRAAAVASAALGVVYMAALLAAGIGTRSEFYLTPWGDPLAFAGRTALMAAFGSFSAVGPFPVDVPVAFEQFFVPWLVASVAVGGTLLTLAVRAARGTPGFALFAAWSVLTLLPQGGAFPGDRLLFLPMVGIAPILAALAVRWNEPGPWRRRAAAIVLAGLTLPGSTVILLFKAFQLRPLFDRINAALVSLEVPRDGQPCEAFVLQSPSMFAMISPGPAWLRLTGLREVRIHALQAGRRALRVRRVDARTLDVEFQGEPMLALAVESVFRSSAAPVEVGERFASRGFEVEVLRVDGSSPREVRVRFDGDVDELPWRVLTWRDGAFRRVELPAPGATLELPRCGVLDPLLP